MEMTTVVRNLATGEKLVYTCSPRQAVVAAYAQSKNDWNTWQYAERYGHLVIEHTISLTCGDFSVFKDGRES